MNDILTEEAKSFRLIKPKTKKGDYKPLVTYTKKLMNNVFFSLASEPEEIFVGLKNLFGPNGATKSFWRYYFPKRFIWSSALYINPRVTEMIDNGITGFSWDYHMSVNNIAKLVDKSFQNSRSFPVIKENARKKLLSDFSTKWKSKKINELIDLL